MADPYQLQWNLKPKIAALQAEASTVRTTLRETYKTKEVELGVERDRLAREQYGLEQQLKSTEQQVKVETREATAIRESAAKLDQDAAAAVKKGDAKLAEELTEKASTQRMIAETHDARLRQIEVAASDLKLEIAQVNHRREEILRERNDLVDQANAAEVELDKLEDQARMLEEARLEYTRAELAGDDASEAGTHLDAAEKLVTAAGALTVDRDTIRVLVPDLPDATPGYDDPAPPLPDGSELDSGDAAAGDAATGGDDVVGDLGDGAGGALAGDPLADGADGVEDADAAPDADGADVDVTGAPDATSDAAVSTDGFDAVDPLDGADALDDLSGLDASDGLDAADGAAATDGLGASDALDGADALDDLSGLDATDGFTAPDGVDPADALGAIDDGFSDADAFAESAPLDDAMADAGFADDAAGFDDGFEA